MTKIHGFVLVPQKTEEERIEKDISVYSQDPDNLWKDIKPHVTLFLCSLKNNKQINRAKQIAEKFASDLKPIKIAYTQPQILGDNYIEVGIKNISEIKKYHETLLSLIQPVSQDCFNPKYLDLDLNTKQLRYLHKYGYFRVKEYFNPHMTLAKFKNAQIRNQKLNNVITLNGEYQFDKLMFDESIEGSLKPAKVLYQKNLGR